VLLLGKVEGYQRMLTRGLVKNRADLALRLGTTRARITQVLSLLRLHPDILEHVRSLPAGTPSRLVTERSLRPLTRLSFEEQLKLGRSVLPGFKPDLPGGAARTTFERIVGDEEFSSMGSAETRRSG